MGSGQVDTKEAGKVGAKEAANVGAKEAANVGAKEAGKVGAKEATKEDAKPGPGLVPGLSEEQEQLEMAEFSWDEQGFSLLSSLYSDMAAHIDEKIRWVVGANTLPINKCFMLFY